MKVYEFLEKTYNNHERIRSKYTLDEFIKDWSMAYEGSSSTLENQIDDDFVEEYDAELNKMYENYEFLLKIKDVVGLEGIKKLYDLANDELVQLIDLLFYLKKNS